METPVSGHADRHRPLGGYAALMLAFNGAATAGLIAAERAGRLPERYGAGDLALASVATYKLSRLIAKGRVTRRADSGAPRPRTSS
jgi:hypothetical protein